MKPPQTRAEDSGTNVKWKDRRWDLRIKIIAGLALVACSSLATMVGARAVPGGLLVGSLQDVAMLKQHQNSTDSLADLRHMELLRNDSIHVVRIDRVERRLSLHDEILKAFTRDKCGTYGIAKAEALGYPCGEVGLHITPGVP